MRFHSPDEHMAEGLCIAAEARRVYRLEALGRCRDHYLRYES